MHPILSALEAHGGVATWGQLTARVQPGAVVRATAAGRIVRLLPRVYTSPGGRRAALIRLRGALLFGGDGSVLSHTTALAQWPRLHLPSERRIHILVPHHRNRRSTEFVVVHRYRADVIPQQMVVDRYGLPTITASKALVDAWAVLPPNRRRAPVIDALRLGLVHADALMEALRAQPRLAGRAELRQLIGLVRAGCHSELELMGFTRVFNDRRLPPSQRQYAVIADGVRFVLDVAWPELLLAVELDGAAYHGSSEARERDVQRDSALARAGWLTIRVTYDRLTQDATGVIAELVGVIATRRRQLGPAA